MTKKEAISRIKINKLLEKSGWRFFDSNNRKANIRLESSVKIHDSVCDTVVTKIY